MKKTFIVTCTIDTITTKSILAATIVGPLSVFTDCMEAAVVFFDGTLVNIWTTKAINKSVPSCLLPQIETESSCETGYMKIFLTCTFIFLQIELVFIWKVLHGDWLVLKQKLRKTQLGIGLMKLLEVLFNLHSYAEYFLIVYNFGISWILTRSQKKMKVYSLDVYSYQYSWFHLH